MKLTKYRHACFVLEHDGASLVVDPGNFSDDFVVPPNVVAVVLTHQHPDHCDPEKLRAICAATPDVPVYALDEVREQAEVDIHPVKPGDTVQAGGFTLEFTGGAHATIHPDIPGVGNVGVVVNHDLLYYPGDSFTQPPRAMQWIAVPVAAPWCKISEVIDFLRVASPEHAFPTHDAILSDTGKALVDRLAPSLGAEETTYQRVASGESIAL